MSGYVEFYTLNIFLYKIRNFQRLSKKSKMQLEVITDYIANYVDIFGIPRWY